MCLKCEKLVNNFATNIGGFVGWPEMDKPYFPQFQE